jgi:hypothetical protein
VDDDICAQCGKTLAPWPYQTPKPETSRDEHGTPMQWCSSACSDAWMAADPKRREGWISVGDLTPERLNEMLGEVGLGLAGVGKPASS